MLEPLADATGRHVLSAEAIFADDTPINMLAPHFRAKNSHAGFEDLSRAGALRAGTLRGGACMAHVRHKFVDIHWSQGSPIAQEAIGRIAQLHAVEKQAQGSPRDRRAQLKSVHAAPVFYDLDHGWPCNSPRSRANPR